MIALDIDLQVEVNGKTILVDCRLQVEAGEVYGVIGRSGSGKSTLALAIAGLSPKHAIHSGHVLLHGRDLLRCTRQEIRAISGKHLALVLQAAASALNPFLNLEAHFREAWLSHSSEGVSTQSQRVTELLESVGLPATSEFLRRRPSQISIGQAQRVLLAMALLHRPQLLILDEPTSALDCIARADVQQLIRRINGETGVTVLYISHDLHAVCQVCTRIGVLHEGTIVESGSPAQLFAHPEHPATRALAAAFRQGLIAPPCSTPEVSLAFS